MAVPKHYPSAMEFVPPNRRFRLFFDETGNGDLHAAEKSPNERYLSLTGVVIRQDHHDRYVTRRLNALKQDIFGVGPSEKLVLHRRDIMRGEGRFSVLRNSKLRSEFDARLLAIVSECLVTAFTISIDKAAHKQKYVVWQYSPYHYVLECLAERFVRWLERHDAVGDIVGEARNPTHDKRLRQAYKTLHLRGNTFVSSGQFQSRLTSGSLRLLPKDADVAGLQIADLLAHPAHRSFKFEQIGETEPEDFGSLLAAVLRRKTYDRNGEGRIQGIGRKWLP